MTKEIDEKTGKLDKSAVPAGHSPDPESDRENRRRITLWSLVWAITFVAVAWAIAFGDLPPLITAAAAIVSGLFGIATFRAYSRFLRETDELRRKIEVDALALAFGIGVVGGLTYYLVSATGLLPPANVSVVVAAMMLVHPVGVALGRRRFS